MTHIASSATVSIAQFFPRTGPQTTLVLTPRPLPLAPHPLPLTPHNRHRMAIDPEPVLTCTVLPPPRTVPVTWFRLTRPCTVSGCDVEIEPEPV
jgi:hypothetical protein